LAVERYQDSSHSWTWFANIIAQIGERKDFEVYSCDVSPDGKRLVTAAGGELSPSVLWAGGRQKRMFRRVIADSLNLA
jgi:WD40 repeat protein